MLFCGIFSLSAQHNSPIVTQEILDKNGELTVKKKRLGENESITEYLKKIKAEYPDAKGIEITIKDDHKTMTFSDNNFESLQESLIAMQSKISKKAHRHSKHRKHYDYRQDNENYIVKERALLGIYPRHSSRGVEIGSLVSDGGAKKAGLQSGDLITAVNGKELSNERSLQSILRNHKPGETVTVVYERNGQSYTTQSTLTGTKTYTKRRNPCKIFIGVQLGGAERGVRISGIIDGTAADNSDLQSGDIITAMDGIEVNSFNELLVERNKHEPGDAFILSILRDGQSMFIDAQFLSCDKELEEPKEEPIEEEIIEPDTNNNLPLEFTNNELQLEELQVYPNPTYGRLNLQFKGEAAPTTIRITDISGKTVYSENLTSFDGYYQRQLMIENATPGNMVVTIQQGAKVISQQVLLLPRA